MYLTLQLKVLFIHITMNKEAEDIKMIRRMMEKSSKFLSFNGLSIVFAGLFALAGAAFVYLFIHGYLAGKCNITQVKIILLFAALVVLFLSVCSVTFFCWRKAKANHETLFSSTTRRAASSLLLPLLTGGVFSLVLLYRGDFDTVFAATLIFYGLGLINVSKYTLSEIFYLGISVIVLGLLAHCFTHLSLYFWAIGFGFCHIIIGFIMYFKYEKTGKEK